MFRRYVYGQPVNFTDQLLSQHPIYISNLLEQTWLLSPQNNVPYAGSPIPLVPGVPRPLIGFNHLIYAYMIENTRIYEIFRRVVYEVATGEKLGIPSTADAQRWLRITEELFFSNPHSGTIAAQLTSDVRPDLNAVRRNAYYRMFYMDLNHGTDDNKMYPFVKPAASNAEFIDTLVRLLIETWRGIKNVSNTSGTNDTDNDALATLCTRLCNMLNVRRLNGNLAREEFWFTSMMDWFHLSINSNTAIVRSLRAEAAGAEDRLRKIGESVGLPCHAKTQAFIYLADEMSLFLRQIEAGMYNSTASAQTLYRNPTTANIMSRIITQYSIATGIDLKANPVEIQGRVPTALSKI